jgi:hypothetical protein
MQESRHLERLAWTGSLITLVSAALFMLALWN